MNKENLPSYVKDGQMPMTLVEGIQKYVDYGIPTGSFLRACLENNFTKAVQLADNENKKILHLVADYIYWEIPGNCWGSAEKVREWLKKYEEISEARSVENKF